MYGETEPVPFSRPCGNPPEIAPAGPSAGAMNQPDRTLL